MVQNARVFIDTSARKHSIRQREFLRPVRGAPVYEFATEDPTSGVSDTLRAEIDLLTKIAELAREGRINLLTHGESDVELLGTLMIPGPGTSVFDNIEMENIESPVEYSRIVAAPPYMGLGSAKHLQIAFLRSIQDKRYIELQRACGAYQGNSVKDNQLVDAFHVWCAEHAQATHFLTTDFKLTRVVKTFKGSPIRVKIVKPSELLADLGVFGE